MSVPWSLRLLPLLACLGGLQGCAVNPVPTPGTANAANVGEDFKGDAAAGADVTEAAFKDTYSGGGTGSDAAGMDTASAADVTADVGPPDEDAALPDAASPTDASLPTDATMTSGEVAP